MSTMQTFYDHLASARDLNDAQAHYLARLTQLTRATLAQVAVLDLEWLWW